MEGFNIFQLEKNAFQLIEFLKYKLKSINLNTEHMKIVFKKLLIILGLIAIFASVVQHGVDDYSVDSSANGQVTVLQLDKDNNRDVGDTLPIAVVLYKSFAVSNSVHYFYSASYQEPILLVQQRPPNA